MYSHIHHVISRMSDLDTQRHINNSFYGYYAIEAQYALLQQNNLDLKTLVERSIHLETRSSSVSFHRQQAAFTDIEVHSNFLFNLQGEGFWNHKIFSGKTLAATVTMKTVFLKELQPFLPEELLAFTAESEHQEIPDELKNNIEFAPFSENCKRSQLQIPLRYTDLNAFRTYSTPLFWRFTEESRWRLLDDIGITLDFLFGNDMMFFLLRNDYIYYPVKRQKNIHVVSWFEKMTRSRSYIRQQITTTEGELMAETVGEFVLVSLSRSKPIRLPPFLIEAASEYMESFSKN